MATMTTTNIASEITDRFGKLEQRIDDHINQEQAREAALDEMGRQMRVAINQHSDERVAAIDAVIEQMAACHRARVRALRKEQEDNRRNALYQKIAYYLIIAAAAVILFVCGVDMYQMTAGLIIASGGAIALRLIGYALARAGIAIRIERT